MQSLCNNPDMEAVNNKGTGRTGRKRTVLADECRATVRQRIESGLTQKELAGVIGISESAVCRILQGKRGLSLPNASRLAKFLKISTDAVFAEI